jgi:alpha-beta hydrolase superfamily lysophospholipase
VKTVVEHERNGHASLSETRSALIEEITKKVQDGAYPELLNEILRRRIDKVSGYVEFP